MGVRPHTAQRRRKRPDISQLDPNGPSKAGFDRFDLRPELLQAVSDAGFTSPRPVQEQAMPPALAGRDVLGLAQTGTGVHYSSVSDEWTTPCNIIDLVLEALGSIDLDPCADEAHSVQAVHHFVQTDDGLDQDWHGRVYMNPPYGREIERWVAHLCREYRMGRTTEAIALLPARTDTAWMRRLESYPKCFIRGRLRFGNRKSGAPFPSVAVYFGTNVERFGRVFQSRGTIHTTILILDRCSPEMSVEPVDTDNDY